MFLKFVKEIGSDFCNYSFLVIEYFVLFGVLMEVEYVELVSVM